MRICRHMAIAPNRPHYILSHMDICADVCLVCRIEQHIKAAMYATL